MLTLKCDPKRCQKPGGDCLIKVGMDVQQVQNLGRAKFPQKT